MNRFYLIVVLFGAAVVILTWISVRRKLDGEWASLPLSAFLRFMIFLVAGIAILLTIIWLIDTYGLHQRFGGGSLILLTIALALPVYFITRRQESANKKTLERRSSIILFALTLPAILYWAVIEGMDPVVLTAVTFIGSIVVIVLLSRNLWRG
jgi:dipeptide/tripeptide permease